MNQFDRQNVCVNGSVLYAEGGKTLFLTYVNKMHAFSTSNLSICGVELNAKRADVGTES